MAQLEDLNLGDGLVVVRSHPVDHKLLDPLFHHIQEVGAEFVTEHGSFYPIFLHDEICGVLWEYVPDTSFFGALPGTIHFGIFTYPETPKGLHIVKRYLSMNSGRHLILHTTPKCGVIDFYQKKYGFHPYRTVENRVMLEKP